MFLGTGSSPFGVEFRVKGFDLTYGSGHRFVSFRGRFLCQGVRPYVCFWAQVRFFFRGRIPCEGVRPYMWFWAQVVSFRGQFPCEGFDLTYVSGLWLAQELDWDTPRPFLKPVNKKSSDLPRNPCLQSLPLFKRSGAEV